MSARVEFAYSLREQAALNARMCRLLYGPLGRWALTLPSIVLTVAALMLSGLVADLLAPEDWALAFIGSVAILGGLAVWGSRRITTALTRRATGAATLDGVACTLEARPEHLLWTGPEWRTEIAWSGIERIDDGPHAVMLVFRGAGYFAPHRAFADEAARRTFVAACIERMTPEARLRSGLPT